MVYHPLSLATKQWREPIEPIANTYTPGNKTKKGKKELYGKEKKRKESNTGKTKHALMAQVCLPGVLYTRYIYDKYILAHAV